MNIVVDIGNSACKLGVFEGDGLVSVKRFENPQDLRHELGSFSGAMIVANVGGNEWIEELREYDPLILETKTPLPIINNYETPDTLGVDRLALAVGAHQLYPEENCLAIDVGTAINYEYVTSKGKYLGGAISPGIKMRFRALNNYTARLPLVEDDVNPEWIGASTKGSIESGVLNGAVAEVDGVISGFEERYGKIRLLLCGGDAEFFESRLKAPIFVVPNLVLMGLNGILNYNEDRS